MLHFRPREVMPTAWVRATDNCTVIETPEVIGR